MITSLYYVLDGHKPVPATLEEWAKMFEETSSRLVARAHIARPSEITVSTVFLGIDHGFGGPPLLFETMIFGGRHDGWTRRYATWAQAEAGHQDAVKVATRMLVEEPDEDL